MSARPAVELRDEDSTRLVDAIEQALPATVVEDGGTSGPFPCSGSKPGLEYYTVRWVVDPAGRPTDDILESFGRVMKDQGMSEDRSGLDGARPSVTFHDGSREISVTQYEETGLVMFSVHTMCGERSSDS